MDTGILVRSSCALPVVTIPDSINTAKLVFMGGLLSLFILLF
jgi:hypothetical protein